MIRTFTLVLTFLNVLHGAELTVFTSAVAYKEELVSASVWYSDGSWIDKEPEETVIQEGQIIRQVFRDLKPGKYRIVLEPLGPIGFSYALMETHVNLKKDASESVILIAQEQKKLEIPVYLAEAIKKFNDNVMWDLSVSYPGFVGEDKIYQVRAFSETKDFQKFIHYLRSDGEYTLSIWDKETTKGYAYEKTFRVGKDLKSEQGGADQPATAPELKSEGKDKPQPESKVRPQ
jgi:hypothetical protein